MQTVYKIFCQFLQNLKIKLPYDRIILFWGIGQWLMKTCVHKKDLHKNFHCHIIYNRENCKHCEKTINIYHLVYS